MSTVSSQIEQEPERKIFGLSVQGGNRSTILQNSAPIGRNNYTGREEVKEQTPVDQQVRYPPPTQHYVGRGMGNYHPMNQRHPSQYTVPHSSENYASGMNQYPHSMSPGHNTRFSPYQKFTPPKFYASQNPQRFPKQLRSGEYGSSARKMNLMEQFPGNRNFHQGIAPSIPAHATDSTWVGHAMQGVQKLRRDGEPVLLQQQPLARVDSRSPPTQSERTSIPNSTNQVVKKSQVQQEQYPKSLIGFVMRSMTKLKALDAEHLTAKVRKELQQVIVKAKKDNTLWTTPWESWQPDQMDTIRRLMDEQQMKEEHLAQSARDMKVLKMNKRKRSCSPGAAIQTKKWGKSTNGDSAWAAEVTNFPILGTGLPTGSSPKKALKTQKKMKLKNARNKNGRKNRNVDIMSFNPRGVKVRGRRARFNDLDSKHGNSGSDWSNQSVSGFELGKVKLRGTCKKLEKEYFRLLHVPTSEEVRDKETCRKALELFQKKWSEDHDYVYMLSMLKALKQDLQVQDIRDDLAIRVAEFSARVGLEVNDLSEFNSTASYLRGLYSEVVNLGHSDWAANQPEFDGYQVYYLLATKNSVGMSTFLKGLRDNSKLSETVRRAVAIVRSLRGRNSTKFFKIWPKIGTLSQNLLSGTMWNLRYRTLKMILWAYSPLQKSTFPIADLFFSLGFENQDDMLEYLKDCKVVLDPTCRFLRTKLSKPNLIEVKPTSDEHAAGVSHGRLTLKQSKCQGGLAALRHFLK